MNRLEGKVCVVSAAGQGIGRAAVLRMAAEGARVIATDINEELLSQLSQTSGVEVRALDVCDGAAISAFAENAAKEIGAVSVLFNCAGFVHHGSVLECAEDEWDFAFALNVKSMYKMTRAFLPAMLNTGGGAIINMSSVASSVKGVPDRFAYSATKAAVIGLTKSVAADFVGRGIRCNAICPGTVESPSLHDRMRATGDFDAAMKKFVARQPMARLGTCDEIAAMVVYLASDEAKFVTGQAFIIDGGWAN